MSNINVLEPTLEHCKGIVNGSCVMGGREYYNWFSIKYGTGESIWLEGGRILDQFAKIRYFRWCERYIAEQESK